MVVFGAVMVASASAGAASPRPYSVSATEACLQGIPDAVAGLPPATPPSPPARFVYRFPPDRFQRPVLGRLGAWDGQGKNGYAGVVLSFFKSVRPARSYLESVRTGGRVGNVVLDWGYGSVPTTRWRATVRGCLRAGARAGKAPATSRPVPLASLRTFAGYWGGHTRGLRIDPEGHGVEITDAGCCQREYRMTLRVLAARGSLTAAAAVYRVTSFDRYDRAAPKVRTGRIGRLLLRNGIVTNTLTRIFFCSDPAWSATGACGA
jgi:hypothetical protein